MNLINLMTLYNNDLFDSISLPEGIDKNICISTILDVCAFSEPLYTEHDFLVAKINMFFMRYYSNFKTIHEALEENYNPLHNYDRYELRDEKKTNIYNFNETGTDSESVQSDVSAFDSSGYQPSTKDIRDSNNTLNKNTSDNDSYTTNNHLYGNIGVTTSQQMLESEIDLRTKQNIYIIIAKMFFKEFMIGV